jgi:hypothetical protein
MVEHLTFNQVVLGSSPSALTTKSTVFNISSSQLLAWEDYGNEQRKIAAPTFHTSIHTLARGRAKSEMGKAARPGRSGIPWQDGERLLRHPSFKGIGEDMPVSGNGEP